MFQGGGFIIPLTVHTHCLLVGSTTVIDVINFSFPLHFIIGIYVCMCVCMFYIKSLPNWKTCRTDFIIPKWSTCMFKCHLFIENGDITDIATTLKTKSKYGDTGDKSWHWWWYWCSDIICLESHHNARVSSSWQYKINHH